MICLEKTQVVVPSMRLSPNIAKGEVPAAFWLFVYVSISIACHFAPSRQDLRGIGPGILVGAILILMVNAVAASFWTEPFFYAPYLWKVLGLVLGLLGIALGLSLSFCAAVCAISIPRYILRLRSAYGLF